MERWLPIRDFVGYEVSDLGRVRSWWSKGPHVTLLAEPKILKGSLQNKRYVPYLRVTLTVGGRKFTKRIHVLVLTEFGGKRPAKKWALHENGNSTDNRFVNLYWGTPKKNADDRTAHGKTMFGKSNHKAKITAEDCVKIRSLYAKGGITQIELGNRYDLSQGQIGHIVRRDYWRHV